MVPLFNITLRAVLPPSAIVGFAVVWSRWNPSCPLPHAYLKPKASAYIIGANRASLLYTPISMI